MNSNPPADKGEDLATRGFRKAQSRLHTSKQRETCPSAFFVESHPLWTGALEGFELKRL